MGEKFRARFKIRLGTNEENRDQEYKDVLIDYDRLRETKLKPGNTFQFKKLSYLYDKTAIHDYDSKGHPILHYYLGVLNPIQRDPDKEPTIKYKDEKGQLQETTVSADLTNQVFDRGEIKNVIASAQKEPQKFDWLTIVIGLVMGTPLGIIIGVLLSSHGYI